MNAFPDLPLTEVEAFQTKKRGIVIPWKAEGTHYGTFLGVAPTQKRICYRGYTSLVLTPDKKVFKWDYQLNLPDLLNQLGQKAHCFYNKKDALIEYLQKMGTDKAILTVKQTECLAFLCQGLSSKYIATYLKISHKTVECHTQMVKEKLGCIHKEQLIDIVRSKGFYYAFRELFDMLFSRAY